MSQNISFTLPPFLHEQDGEIRLTGHRISIVDILTFYRDGYRPEMLAARYEGVSLALIHRVIAFYRANQDAVDAYLNQYLSDCQRLRQEAAAFAKRQRL